MASAVVQALDSLLGKPPFTVTPELMETSERLLTVLRETPSEVLSKEKQVTDTLPIIATSLVMGFGSSIVDAVPFVRKVVECITEITSISKYPLAQFLKDMRSHFPMEPLVFRLHDAANAVVDIDIFKQFIFVPRSASSSVPPQPLKKNAPQPKSQKQPPVLVGELCSPEMIAAVCQSKSLSAECKKLLAQQLDNATKFTKAVKSDPHCAKVVLDLFSATIVGDLKPSGLHGCLDSILLPHYINLHQQHSEGLGVLAESALISSWSLATQWRMVRWLASPPHSIDGMLLGFLVTSALVLRELSSTDTSSPPEDVAALFELLKKSVDASLAVHSKSPERWEHVLVPLRLIAESVCTLLARGDYCERVDAKECDVTKSLSELSTILLSIALHSSEKRPSLLETSAETKKKSQQKKAQSNEREAQRLQWFGDASSLCAAILSIVTHVDQCYYLQFARRSLLVDRETFVAPLLCEGVLPKLTQLKSEVVTQIIGLLDVMSRIDKGLPQALVVKVVSGVVRKEGAGGDTMFQLRLTAAPTELIKVMTRFLSMLDAGTVESLPLVDPCRVVMGALMGSLHSGTCALGLSASYLRFIASVSEQQRTSAAIEFVRQATRGGATADTLLTQLEALAASFTISSAPEGERNVAVLLCNCMADVMRNVAEADARCKEIEFQERVEAMQRRIDHDTRQMRKLHEEQEALRAARALAEQRREAVAQEAAERLEQQQRKQQRDEEHRKKTAQLRLSKLHQEAKALRNAREASLRASVLAYKQRTSKSRDIETFLKRIDIPEAKALTITSQLYHALEHLSEEQVAEYLVTGSTVVPADMEERKQQQASSFSNEILATPFWELVVRDVGNGMHIDDTTTCAPPESEPKPKPPTHSVHYNLSPLLDLFDYDASGGPDEERQAPPCRVIPAPLIRKVLDHREDTTGYHSLNTVSIPKRHGFDDAMHMVFEAQSRGLVVLEKGVVTLAMLGFAYHCAFWDSERSLRVKLRVMMAQVPLAQSVDHSTHDSSDEASSDGEWDESDWFE